MNTGRHWTPQEDADLIKLWNSGRLVAAEIGATFERGESAVHCRLAKLRKRGVILVDRSEGGQYRGRLHNPPNSHPLVRRLIVEMNHQRATKKEIADRAGLSPTTVGKWSSRHEPTLQDLEAAFNVLGFTLRPVKIKDRGSEA